jgi:hypothetical protein
MDSAVPGSMPVRLDAFLVFDGIATAAHQHPSPTALKRDARQRRRQEGLHDHAAPSLEQSACGLDVARDERPDRLFEVWCGRADALGAIVAIRTVAALSRTLNGAIFRKIAQSALSRTLPHPTGMAF